MITFLKRARVIACSAGLAAALASCTDSVGPRTPDPMVQRLIDMGFSPKEIVDRGSYFIVEGDILFWKENLREPPPVEPNGPFDLPQFQWRTNNGVSGTNVQNIRVNITSGLSAGWAAATRQAMLEWSAVSGTIIEFVETGPADLTVSSANIDPFVALSAFPANGKPGSTIQVDPDFESYSPSEKLFIMAHEFGHTIGFRHSNWSVNLGGNCGPENANPNGAIIIGNTPDTDPNSVMNKCTAGVAWNGFSFWDIEAARVLYDEWPWLSVQMQPNNDRLLTWTSVTGAVSYQIHADYEYCVYEFGTPTCHSGGNASFSTTATEYLDNVPPGGMTDDSCYATYQIWPVFQGGQGQISNTPFRQGWVC